VIEDLQRHLEADETTRRRIREGLDANMLVEAGAGTGKTRALVERYVSLVLNGTPVDRIVAITFTEKAAAEMRERVRSGVEDALRMLGFVTDEELAVLYRAARAHVLVSRCEGFGLTVVEAMASGCPVLTTRGGSLDEVAGDAALTVDPDDHAAIGAAMVRLFSDDALLADLAERGQKRAPQFSGAVQATAMARAYRCLLEV